MYKKNWKRQKRGKFRHLKHHHFSVGALVAFHWRGRKLLLPQKLTQYHSTFSELAASKVSWGTEWWWWLERSVLQPRRVPRKLLYAFTLCIYFFVPSPLYNGFNVMKHVVRSDKFWLKSKVGLSALLYGVQLGLRFEEVLFWKVAIWINWNVCSRLSSVVMGDPKTVLEGSVKYRDKKKVSLYFLIIKMYILKWFMVSFKGYRIFSWKSVNGRVYFEVT